MISSEKSIITELAPVLDRGASRNLGTCPAFGPRFQVVSLLFVSYLQCLELRRQTSTAQALTLWGKGLLNKQVFDLVIVESPKSPFPHIRIYWDQA